MIRDDLGNRMKQYEQVPKAKLIRRMPVVIRIDGKAFHTFTRGFRKPFDELLIETMQETTKYLCEHIQGCVFGYTQSDEITLILVDYKKLDSSSWYDSEVQKMCSISASMATMSFNRIFEDKVYAYCQKTYDDLSYMEALNKAVDKGAMFDARCFNIPKEEVTNCVYWRQLDASRNSIQMLAQANFSHKELQNKSCNDLQDMLVIQRGINWNDLPTYKKRGSCVVKNRIGLEKNGDKATAMLRDITAQESAWIIDKDIPIFKGEGREYVDRLINIGE